MTTLLRTAMSVALAACASSVAFGQSRSATIRVQVLDPTGAVIVGAQVEVRAVDATTEPIRMTTNERGEAAFESLPHGRYTIRAESPGFEPRELPDVRLRTDVRREMKLN